jgi:hypothetical protein
MKIFEIIAENEDGNVTAFPINKRLLDRQEIMLSQYRELLKKYNLPLEKFSFKEAENVTAIRSGGFNNMFELIAEIELVNLALSKKGIETPNIPTSTTQQDYKSLMILPGLQWNRWLDNLKELEPEFYQKLKTFAYPEKLKEVMKILEEFKKALTKFETEFEHFRKKYPRFYAQTFEDEFLPLPKAKINWVSDVWGLFSVIDRVMSVTD